MAIPPSTWMLMLVTAAFPVVTTLAPKGTVIVFVLLALIGVFKTVKDGNLRSVFPKAAALLALAIFVWLFVKTVNTHIPIDASLRLVKVTSLVFFGFFVVSLYRDLPVDQQHLVLNAAASGAFVAYLLMIYGIAAMEYSWAHPFRIDGRSDEFSVFSTGVVASTALLSAFLIPAWQARKRTFALLTVMLALAFAIFTGTLAVVVGLIAAIGAVVFCKLIGEKNGPRSVAVALILLVFALPAAISLEGEEISRDMVPRDQSGAVMKSGKMLGSVMHRFEIWHFTTQKALESPIFGWGFDASRSIPGGSEEIDVGKSRLPLHPHNGVLQVWLELGIPGLILLAAVLWSAVQTSYVVGNCVRNLTRVASIVFLFAIGNATFGIWQSWWMATIIIVFALTTLSPSWAAEDDARANDSPQNAHS